MTSTETTQRAEPITKPPGRWRNRWLALKPTTIDCWTCRAQHPQPLGESLSCGVYPSRELAEEFAIRIIRHDAEHGVTQKIIYLGAVPVEDGE